MIAKFEEFLKENGAFDDYKANYEIKWHRLKLEHAGRLQGREPKSFLDFLAMIQAKPQWFMTKCFVWMGSKQGQKYWSGLNQKWLEVVANASK